MSKNYNQIIAIVISTVMLFAGAAVLTSHSSVVADGNHHADVGFPYGQLATLYIINNLSTPTPSNFDEHIVVNSSHYAGNENANLSNVFFTILGGYVVPSWLQSGNSYTDYNTSFWLRINSSIPAHSVLEIFMDAARVGNNILNNYSIGEAPQLTNDYGLYDDGSHIFNLYDNFAGAKLNTSKWIPLNSNYAVDNGITFTASDSYITSRVQYAHPGYAEAYGVMHSPSTTGSTSYDLGGVGFGKDGMDYTSPVVTSGWAENMTNGPGLTFYNGEGPFQYNYSHSINMNNNHTFGVGFINDSYTIGTVDNVYQNSSRLPYIISGSQMLNVTLGFQTNDFPNFNNFRYIFELNSTASGINLPFTFQSYNVVFHESGLPAGTLWGRNIPNLEGFTENGGLTPTAYSNISLPNGHYNFTISSGDSDYRPANKSGNFTVNGASVTINVSFVPVKYITNFHESGVPVGLEWSAEIYGGSVNNVTFYSTTAYNNISLMNGTYEAIFNTTPSGYIPLPDIMYFSVNGLPHSYVIFYESPLNASYVRPLTSLNPSMREQFTGYNDLASGGSLIPSIAIDNSTNVLFSVASTQGLILAYNITTGNYLSSIILGPSSIPVFDYYDPANGYLYVSNAGTGNLTVINAKTMSIVKNVTLADLRNSAFNIAQSPQSDLIYVFGYNDTNSNDGTVFTLQPSGTIVGEHNFTNLVPQFLFEIFFHVYPVVLSPAVYDQNMMVANGSGIDVLNLSTGSESYYAAPTYYYPSLLYPYGSSGNYMVSNEVNNTTLLFNARSFAYLPGPDVKGQIFSGFTDALNGYIYLSTDSNFPPYTGNITVVSPANGSVLASVYAFTGSPSMAFSSRNQSLFTLDFENGGNDIHTYSVTKAFTVSFLESGLPSGNTWYVNITGGPSSGALQPGATYSVTLINQTYSYTIATTDKSYRATGGTFDANSAISISVDFSPVKYQVKFTESGLPSNAAWKLTLNGTQYSNSTDQITIALINGTYTYSVSSVSGYTITNGTGSVKIDGSSVSISVKFSPVVYQVTISETGLPANSTWTVTVNGHEYNVTGTYTTLSLTNGTYSYSVSYLSGYSITNRTGNITVSGSAASVNVKFSPVSRVSYTLYIEIGAVAAVIIVAGLAAYLWRRSRKT
ncbi:MAG: hypothetical protein ACP5NK_07210 [Thermoplasmata archaeon]